MTRFECEAEVIYWRGPAPFHFARLPPDVCAAIAGMARTVSYGWGVIPVTAAIDSVAFTTSLIPCEGGYLLPLKDAVRKKIRIPDHGTIQVAMALGRAEI